MNERSLLEAAMVIRNDPRFEEFKNFLCAEQNLAVKAMLSAAEERQMFGAQGGYKALQRVKELIETAPLQLDKLAQ